jgi:hypothetical protein
MSSSEENRDLVWDLDTFEDRQLAANFIKRFENKLCVYSSSVEQLYTNYEIYFPVAENRRMVILPNPYAYHDTLQNIPEKAVIKTGLHIMPGEIVGKTGLYLTVPIVTNGVSRSKAIELHTALRAIQSKRSPENPFLPVLIKGDLREFRSRMPMLHLHCIKLNGLDRSSQLERNSVRNVIERKLPSIN